MRRLKVAMVLVVCLLVALEVFPGVRTLVELGLTLLLARKVTGSSLPRLRDERRGANDFRDGGDHVRH